MKKQSTKKGTWTPERTARFQATIAAKRAAANAAAAARAEAPVRAPEWAQEPGVKLTINGHDYPIGEALAVHAAVEMLRREWARA